MAEPTGHTQVGPKSLAHAQPSPRCRPATLSLLTPPLSAPGLASSDIPEKVRQSAEALPTCLVCAQVRCLSLPSTLTDDKGHPYMTALYPSPCPPGTWLSTPFSSPATSHKPAVISPPSTGPAPCTANPQRSETFVHTVSTLRPSPSTAVVLARPALRSTQATPKALESQKP